MDLWLVGYWPEEQLEPLWEVVGIYDSEEKALENCLNWQYFLAPIKLNYTVPKEVVEWPGLRFPKKDVL